MRLPAAILSLALLPGAALAQSNMPQMDFSNMLTFSQIIWMVVILVALYLALSGWGLPEMSKVLANRTRVIGGDLAAARAAKSAADQAAEAMHATMFQARAKAQAEVADMVASAKQRAAAEAKALAAKLDQNLAASEARIAQARSTAMAALKPVAEEAASAIVSRLTGNPAPADAISRRVDDALAAAKAA